MSLYVSMKNGNMADASLTFHVVSYSLLHSAWRVVYLMQPTQWGLKPTEPTGIHIKQKVLLLEV